MGRAELTPFPSTPTRRLVHDFLIHEDLLVAPPELRVMAGRPKGDDWAAGRSLLPHAVARRRAGER